MGGGQARLIDRVRDWSARRLFSPLGGMLHRDWRRLRTLPDTRIDPGFRARAASTWLMTLASSWHARRERRRFGERIRAAQPRAPIFVLGLYRSGTTLLHNLLTADRRFAFPSYYQATFPSTFLTTESTAVRFGSWLALRQRPMDDVPLGLGVPAEDELALCSATLVSPHLGWHFPRGAEHYRSHLTLRQLDEAARDRWKRFFHEYASKLTVRHGRPIVFKSPCHTARVRWLLEIFPDARFVHVHRNPYDVFRSTRHMEISIAPLFQFQHRDFEGLDPFILWRYREAYEAYLEERGRIPPGRLVEVEYERLARDPMTTMQAIYEALDLPDFGDERPAIERHVKSLRGYRRNRYVELEAPIRSRIEREWAACFDAWGYSG